MDLSRFFRRRAENADLERELNAHLAHQIDENLASGMSPEEARRQAYLKLGSPRRVREDVWQWNTVNFFEHLMQRTCAMRSARCGACRDLLQSPY
ncbi:MAG TPA: permease prefix domain 1-containing protein [Candidatus Angelobacter sp.]|jgi:hypothetical protein|nr:permease prefix domain 1-containing protein [Candidatus Angelobacter sp.]